MKDSKFLKFGVLGGVIASMCCWGPLLLISLGLIGTSGALSIGYQSPWFFGVGIVFTAIFAGLYIRKKIKSGDCSTKKDIARTAFIGFSIVIAMIVTTYLLKDVLVPYIAPLVFS